MDWAPGRIGAVAATADVEHRHESISIPVHCINEHLEEPDESYGCRWSYQEGWGRHSGRR